MQVPDGWRKMLLSSVAEVRAGVAKGKQNLKDPVELPYLRVANVQDGYIDLSEVKHIQIERNQIERFSLKIGDVLMTEGGDFDKLGRGDVWNGKINPCLHQNHVFAVRPNQLILDSYFLAALSASYYGKTYFLSCSKQSTNLASINSTQLKNFPVLLPPLPEQQKIAQILSTWDKAIEKLEALIAAKQKRKKALMQQLLTGKKRFAEFVKSEGIQKTKFGTIPSDWQYLHIADIAKQFSVKNNAGHDLPVLSCTKYYGLVDSLAYFGKRIFSEDTSTYKVVPRNAFAYATNHIEEGSIGYQSLYDKALISPMYTVFQTKENINDEFLYRLLKTELYRHIFEVNTSASVDRRGSLRWDQFSAIRIPVPYIPEQQKIASFFAVTDKEIEAHQKHLSSLKEQKKGLMQQLLTGKKRVKVDSHV